MNYRMAVFIFVVSTIGGLGWYHAQRLSDARERQRLVQMEAQRLGLPSASSSEVPHKSQVRKNQPPEANLLTPEDIAVLRKLEAAKASSGNPISFNYELMTILRDRFKTMNAAQARKYIAEMRASDDILLEVRKAVVFDLIHNLSNNDLVSAIDLYVRSIDMLPPDDSHFSLGRMITNWAEKDHASALAWTRANAAEHRDLFNNEVMSSLIKGTAQTDRKLAFQLIDELKIYPPSNATQPIVGTAKTAEERIAALAELREYALTIEDERDRFQAMDYALAVFGKNLAEEGFESAVKWVDDAGLTDSEIASFGSDIIGFIKAGEREKWINWFATRLSEGPYQRPIRNIMQPWAYTDHEGAALWLHAAPEGPVRNHAISVFAVEVANRQPDAAVEWAVYLPPGKQRDDTLHKIYHNWPTKDRDGKAAAAAFEKKYNIQHDH